MITSPATFYKGAVRRATSWPMKRVVLASLEAHPPSHRLLIKPKAPALTHPGSLILQDGAVLQTRRVAQHARVVVLEAQASDKLEVKSALIKTEDHLYQKFD